MYPETFFGKDNIWRNTNKYAARMALLIQRSLKSLAAKGKDGT